MRATLHALCCCLLLGVAGCAETFGALLGADVASVAVFGRSVGDMVASGVTGRDCSIVRLDKGQTYCADPHLVGREAYCTRTLARVDCWPTPPSGRTLVADTPVATAEQERYRGSRWPRALSLGP